MRSTRAVLRAALLPLALLGAAASIAGAGGPAGCAIEGWPQPRQSSCADGTAGASNSPSAATIADVRLAWTYVAGAPVGDAIVQQGRVFAVSGTSPPFRLHALDLATGNLHWKAIAGRSNRPTPLAGGGALLRMSASNVLRRYDPKTGRIFWRRNHVSEVSGSPAEAIIADDGWFFSTGSQVVSYGVRRGERRWSRPITCFHCGISAAEGRVYAGGNTTDQGRTEGALHALNARTGEMIWSRTRQGVSAWSTVVVAGTVLLDTKTRRGESWSFGLEAFRASDGRPLWRAPLGSARGFWFTPPAADVTQVVYPSTDGFLYSVDVRTGRPRWKTRIGVTQSAPALANDVVWIVSDVRRALLALSGQDGRELGSWPLGAAWGDAVTPSPAVADGFVLVGTPDGRLLALRAEP